LFADAHAVADGVVGLARRGEVGAGFANVVHGAAEADNEFVAAGAEAGLHVPAVGDEHVVGRGDLFAVEKNGGDGVEAVGAELDAVLAEEGGGGGELGAVFPVALLDPLQVEFVDAVKRVGDFAGGEQVGVNAAGDGGGEQSGGLGGGCVAEFPAGFGQVEEGHGRERE